ncbi:MAG: L,D-transpeptidase family protein [Verrucomicrobia bacterium]|nr:L,D-transpeptidase family protein [Verrucomicrobiota bacterium]
MIAATCLDQKEIVLALLDKGANRYAATAPTKVFPIQFAAKRENVQMQQILIGVPWQDDKQERQFVINLSTQKATLIKNGKVIKTSGISSGRSTHPTIPGKYVITDKELMHHSNLYGDAEMPFFQRFSCTAMGFHEGALPGYAASHGCVRLPRSTAEFFFKESKIGDRVDIVKN